MAEMKIQVRKVSWCPPFPRVVEEVVLRRFDVMYGETQHGFDPRPGHEGSDEFFAGYLIQRIKEEMGAAFSPGCLAKCQVIPGCTEWIEIEV